VAGRPRPTAGVRLRLDFGFGFISGRCELGARRGRVNFWAEIFWPAHHADEREWGGRAQAPKRRNSSAEDAEVRDQGILSRKRGEIQTADRIIIWDTEGPGGDGDGRQVIGGRGGWGA
jgi:hypothetical protein